MKTKAILSVVLIVGYFGAAPLTAAKEHKALSWAYVGASPVEVRPSASNRKPAFTRLGRGALVGVYDSVSKGSVRWSQVKVIQLATFSAQMGWLDSSQIESIPLERFPTDADLLKELGGTYLDDFVSSHTEIARFLVRQNKEEPALACFLGCSALPQARLQVFRRSQGKFLPGSFLEFPFSELKAGITALEVQDLLGDGIECLVTYEPFDLGPENRGVNLVIRRMEGSELRELWQAPLEHRNLASFPSKPQQLEPLEKNIGMPGTVTTGTVDFPAHGRLRDPVWKGKVEFYVVGREEPVKSVPMEKVCGWDGRKFKPLR